MTSDWQVCTFLERRRRLTEVEVGLGVRSKSRQKVEGPNVMALLGGKLKLPRYLGGGESQDGRKAVVGCLLLGRYGARYLTMCFMDGLQDHSRHHQPCSHAPFAFLSHGFVWDSSSQYPPPCCLFPRRTIHPWIQVWYLHVVVLHRLGFDPGWLLEETGDRSSRRHTNRHVQHTTGAFPMRTSYLSGSE